MQRRRHAVRIGAVLLWLGLLSVGSGAAAQPDPDALTAVCSALPGEDPLTISIIDDLVTNPAKRQFDRAEELYRAVLADDPGDVCAVRGLARVSEERAAAARAAQDDEAKQEEAQTTPFERALERWDTLYTGWLQPATELVLVALAILLLLLVLSRLTTRAVVPADADEGPEGAQRVSWLVGLLLLCLAASLPIVLSLPVQGEASRLDAALATAAVLAVASCALLLAARWTRRQGRLVGAAELVRGAALGAALVMAVFVPQQPRAADLVLLAFVVVVALAGYLGERRLQRYLDDKLPPDEPTAAPLAGGRTILGAVIGATVTAAVLLLPGGARGEAWSWSIWLGALAVSLAFAGGTLIGLGRGLRLSLRVDARTAAGEGDGREAQYLLARLQAMGSAPPRGIEIPRQPDVTALPEEALTTLPQGRIVGALFNVLQAILPTVPWRASVALVDHDTATVTLSRNGHPAEVTRISRPNLGLPEVPAEADGEARADQIDVANTQLLTAAAAVILHALSKRHPQLRNGLCGATRWESVALHVLATEEPLTDDRTPEKQALRKRLLAKAVQLDPGNALTRVAYLHCFGRRSPDPDDQQRFAELIGDASGELFRAGEPTPAGFEALRLRMRYSRAVAWLNVHLLADTTVPMPSVAREAWHKARRNAHALMLALDEPMAPHVHGFVRQLRPLATWLWLGVQGRFDPSLLDARYPPAQWKDDGKEIAETMMRWIGETGALSLHARYNHACTLAQGRGADPQKLRQAIGDLRAAVGDEDLRIWARQDPSLAAFRLPTTDQQLRADYKKLVGDPAPSQLLDLAPFATHAEQLRAYGVDDPDRLLEAWPWRLAVSLDVARPAVERWRDVARLAKATADDNGIPDVAALGLLLSLGLESPEALWRRLQDKGEEQLYADLVSEGPNSAYEPDKKTVSRWEDRRPRVGAREPGPR